MKWGRGRGVLMVLAVATVALALAGCSQLGIPSLGDSSSEAAHLQDNESVYDNQDDTSVVTMYLTVSTGTEADETNHTWTEINEYSAYDYEEMGVDKYKAEALLQVGDESGPVEGELGYDETEPNATVQIRGHSSSLSPQKSYKVKIKKGAGTWNDQRVINLNKHPFDGLHFRNKLGFDMLRRIPELMSLRTQYVHLYVRDTTEGGSGQLEDYGLYTQVENLDDDALAAHGLDGDGWLYKAESFEFYQSDALKTTDDADYDKDAFEEVLEIEGNEDHSKLIAMVDDVNDDSIPTQTLLAEHFDTQNLAYWMAFNILTGNVDTENQNFYLYSPTDSDTWYFLCWDLDGMMFYDEGNLKGDNNYASWRRGVSNYWNNVLFRRCLEEESFREELDAAVSDLLDNDITEDAVRQMVDAYSAVVKPYTYADPTKSTPLSEEEYDEVANGLPALLSFYDENYEGSLQRPMPFFIGTPTVSDGTMTVNWAESYDFADEWLTYTATVARDPDMTDVVSTYTGDDLSTTLDDPGEGQYYLQVTVSDASGNTQDAFDIFRKDDGEKVYGCIAFTEGADGVVTRN